MPVGLLLVLRTAAAVSVFTSPWPPIVSCELGSANFASFSGYDMDLLREVAVMLRWDRLDVQCVEWNEMLRGVQQGRADLAMAGINIETSRLNSLRFSTPTYESGLSLVTQVSRASLFWLLFTPFDSEVWLALAVSILLLSHVLWVVERREGGIKLRYFDGVLNSFWIVSTSFCSSTDRQIFSIPGRVIQLALGFSAFLIFSLYIGSLTVRLTLPFPSQTIESYRDLGDKDIGYLADYESIVSRFSQRLTPFPWDGSDPSGEIVAALQRGEIDVAALEHPQALYYSSRKCGISVIDFNFVELYYAAAFAPHVNETFIRDFSIANSALKERFVHDSLMNKYLNQVSNEKCSGVHAHGDFTLMEIPGVYAVVICGLALSGALFLLQLVLRRKSREQQDSEPRRSSVERESEELQAELKLVKMFDRILLSADQKLGQKLEVLEKKLEAHQRTSSLFEEAMRDLSSKLDKTFS